MEATPDVIRDLLPLYHARAVSEDSRRLVEAYLAQDPALAAEAERMAAVEDVEAVAPPPDLEVRTLERARRAILARSWVMGGAIFFSLLPFSAASTSGGIDWVTLRDAPALAVASALVAVGGW